MAVAALLKGAVYPLEAAHPLVEEALKLTVAVYPPVVVRLPAAEVWMLKGEVYPPVAAHPLAVEELKLMEAFLLLQYSPLR